MRFLILGAGGLGGYYGGVLLKSPADVAFLVRPRRAAQLAARGLVVKNPEGDFVTPVKTLLAGEVNDPYDIVLLACKAHDLDSAIEAIAPAVGPESAVLPVLNGIDHITILTDRFGDHRVLGGMSLVRAELSPGGDIIRPEGSGLGKTSYGELNRERSARCEAIQTALAAGGVVSTISDDILAEMWAKFCGFATAATIAALIRARAGEIASAGAGATFVDSVFEECARVTAAEGYPTPPEMGDLVRGMFARAGSTYGPSILWDLENGRRTEGEHTVGDMVRRADRHGLEVPLLRAALCNLQIHEARVRAVARA
jgi:2-dehydropantoate 2-reductase